MKIDNKLKIATDALDDPLTVLYPGDTMRVVVAENETAVFVDRYTPTPPTTPLMFAWITDPHVGHSGYEVGHPAADIAHILGLDPAFVIVSGDCTHEGTAQQMADYLACWPTETAVFQTPGNHDEKFGYEAPPPNDYTHYIEAIDSFRWAFSQGGIRFIGFTTNLKRGDLYAGFGWVGNEDRAFVESNLSLTERNVLITHFPFDDGMGNNVHDWYNFDAGQGWLYGLAETYDIVLLTGHRHRMGLSSWPRPNSSLIEVNGGCLAYDEGNGYGSFQIVTVTDGQLQIDRYLGRPPYNLLESVSV